MPVFDVLQARSPPFADAEAGSRAVGNTSELLGVRTLSSNSVAAMSTMLHPVLERSYSVDVFARLIVGQ